MSDTTASAPIRTRYLKWRSIRPGAHAATDPATHYTYTVERSKDGPGWDVYSHEFGTTHFRNNTTSYIEAKHDASRFAYEDHRTLMAERMAQHRKRRAELVALAEAGDVHARNIVGTPIAPTPSRTLVLVGKVGPRFGATLARVTSAGRTVQVQGQRDALSIALNAIAADYAEAVAS